MRGWETPTEILELGIAPITAWTALSELRVLRAAARVRANVFPDATLAYQALEALIELREAIEAEELT